MTTSLNCPPVPDRAPYDPAYLDECVVKEVREDPDYREYTLHHAGVVVARLCLRYLPGKRLWPTWRETVSSEDCDPPKGVQDRLQTLVLGRYPGWSLTSCPGEMSEFAQAFREGYLARHPSTVWTLDRDLEGDEGVSWATPRMTGAQVAQMLAAD